jgi:cytoskeleton protein RodZ
MRVVVRRRAGLMGLVAVVSAAVAALYLTRFADNGGAADLAVGASLALVAFGHAFACRDARTPLFVGDERGLRIRLGTHWVEVPWRQLERVEVEERGRFSDGHVTVSADVATLLAGASGRTRLSAALNRRLYDAPLAAPYGPTTSVSVVDVPEALRRLAGDRAEVVVDGSTPVPEPTVEITPRRGPVPVGASSPAPWYDHAGAEEAASRDDAPARRLSQVVTAARAAPARREEVAIPVRHDPAAVGILALSSPAEGDDTQPLPEAAQLHRPDGFGDIDPAAGNVGLIIDATTDLSARAMSRLRRPHTTASTAGSAADADLSADREQQVQAPEGPLIGHELRQARIRLGLTVEELSERTSIRPYVIEHAELDDFAPCGGDFYSRGHLRMLARVLGIDAAPLVATYDEHFAASPVNAREVFEVELASGTSGVIKGTGAGPNWGALVAAVLVLLLVWGVARYVTGDPSRQAGVANSRVNSAGSGAPAVGNVLFHGPRIAHARLTAVGGGSRVVVRDRFGHRLFAGLLAAGHSTAVAGAAPLRVVAADGGVVRLTVHGRSRGLLGQPGRRTHTVVHVRH